MRDMRMRAVVVDSKRLFIGRDVAEFPESSASLTSTRQSVTSSPHESQTHLM